MAMRLALYSGLQPPLLCFRPYRNPAGLAVAKYQFIFAVTQFAAAKTLP
jgi:hypothetical protein